jgi:tRNA A37 N6-isopentenylltransferase MiaA
MPTLPILAIGGPTAVGKSAAALALANALDAAGVSSVVVSADSRQVFRGFDIGTDKISAEIRAVRPHACIDIAEASDSFTLYDWLDAARAAIAGHAQTSGGGGIAIVVGGTGLYQRGLLKGFLSGGARPSNPLIREQLELQFANVGREPLDQELRERNPAAADAVATASARRLIRGPRQRHTCRLMTLTLSDTVPQSPHVYVRSLTEGSSKRLHSWRHAFQLKLQPSLASDTAKLRRISIKPWIVSAPSVQRQRAPGPTPVGSAPGTAARI